MTTATWWDSALHWLKFVDQPQFGKKCNAFVSSLRVPIKRVGIQCCKTELLMFAVGLSLSVHSKLREWVVLAGVRVVEGRIEMKDLLKNIQGTITQSYIFKSFPIFPFWKTSNQYSSILGWLTEQSSLTCVFHTLFLPAAARGWSWWCT